MRLLESLVLGKHFAVHIIIVRSNSLFQINFKENP